MATEPNAPPSFTPHRRWRVGFDVAVRTVVVLAVVVMANYLAGKFSVRKYLSPQTNTQLAPRTINLVRGLTNEVKVTLYYNRDNDLYPTVAALLGEYARLNSRLQIETVDYLRDAAAAQRVKLAHQLPDSSKEEEKNFIIFECEGRKEVVNGYALGNYEIEVDQDKGTYERRTTAFKGEMMFTAKLLSVTSPRPLKAYVLQGHGEHDLNSGDEVLGYQEFRSILAQNNIKLEALFLTGTNTVPGDCNLLIVPGPRAAIPDAELETISQYLNEGGRLFALFNAATLDQRAGLEKVLARDWNVSVRESVVTDPDHSLNFFKAQPSADVAVGAFSKHPAVSALIGFNLDLIYPRPVFPITPQETTAETPKVDILFATEKTATLLKETRPKPRQYPLAVAVERGTVAGVATGRGTTRMVIVGDSMFLANTAIKQVANRDFAGYAINWLLERPQLTEGLGPRPMNVFRIALTRAQLGRVQWLLLAALPGGILLFGGLVWLRRQK
jgi:hypothetical protein